jgi:hypothetical protein
MEVETYSFRHAETILLADFKEQYSELLGIIKGIGDENIREEFLVNGKNNKSLSTTINRMLKVRFLEKGWTAESRIFKDDDFKSGTWRIDFAKDDISVEVGFNHGTVAAWNLIKPTIAGELNHIQKEHNTKIGIVITATQKMKKNGGYDNAIGTFESYIKYIKALNNILTIPILLIGLKELSSFKIIHQANDKGKKIGGIEDIAK